MANAETCRKSAEIVRRGFICRWVETFARVQIGTFRGERKADRGNTRRGIRNRGKVLHAAQNHSTEGGVNVGRTNRGRTDGGASHSLRSRVFSIKSDTRNCIECGKPLSIIQNTNARYCYDCRYKRSLASHRTSAKAYARAHKAEMAIYQRERYQWLREHGICVSCGVEEAELGFLS